eukprot:scaffold83055_cov36-Phaeocystis_antarctica.AAC.1
MPHDRAAPAQTPNSWDVAKFHSVKQLEAERRAQRTAFKLRRRTRRASATRNARAGPHSHSVAFASIKLLLGGELGGLGTPCRARAHRASHHGRLGGGGGAVGAATGAAAPTLSVRERLV